MSIQPPSQNRPGQQTKGFALTTGKMMNLGGSVLEAGMDFYTRREMNPNESIVKSAAMAGITFAEWALAPGVMWGLTLGEVGQSLGEAAGTFGATNASARHGRYGASGMVGGNFFDSEKGYTARQRGLQAIESSRMNARSALGNEARSLHRR